MALEIGMKAPEFCLANQDANEVCLKDFSNKWVVLYFYPKDNTPGCTKEACDFTQNLPEFEGINAVVFGISPDSTTKHQKFIQKHDIKITLLSDEGKEVLKKYDAWGMKKMCGKECEGVIRSTYIIAPGGEIKAVWSNVKVRQKKKGVEIKHADVVKEKLLELQS